MLVSVIVRFVSLSQIISFMSVRCQSRYVFVRRMLCARMCVLWSKNIFIKNRPKTSDPGGVRFWGRAEPSGVVKGSLFSLEHVILVVKV